MFNYDVKFITSDDTLYLKSGDFKSFKYDSKKRLEETVYDAAKRNYCERRGGYWRIPKSSQLRQLESTLRDRSIIACEWVNELLATLVFSSGVIAYISIKPNTLDVTQILFDRYCVGKLSGQIVTGVALSKTHLLFTHAERTATLFTFGKNLDSGMHPCRLSDKDPHVQTLELGGARRVERRVSWSSDNSGLKVLLWSAANPEPAPWSPVLEDLANLHLYHIHGQQVSLIAYHQLENEVLCAELSQKNDNVVHIVEQTASNKNGITLEWQCYDISHPEERVTHLSTMRDRWIRASLPGPVRVARRSACGRRLLAACIDGTLHIVHHSSGLTHSVRAGFIPTDVRWAGELLIAVEETGRLQCFDRALSLLHHHTKCLDLLSHFRDTKRMQILETREMKGGPLMLALFSGGPLTLLRIKHPRLLTTWIRADRTSNAVALLRAMDWEEEGLECLRGMNELVHGALRKTNDSSESQSMNGEAAAQAALGAFLAPSIPLGSSAQRFAPPVHDLARKFFHHLLRRGRIEKAMSLAVDLAAWDLFADARWAAQRLGLAQLAQEASRAARHYARSQATESECSDSCSQCSSRTCSESEEELNNYSGAGKTSPPPLPRVPLPPDPTILSVPITQNESKSTMSIRPNLHQYIERDNTIWHTGLRDDTCIDSKVNDGQFKPIKNLQSIKWQSVDNMLLDYRKPLSNSSASDTLPRPLVVETIPRIQEEKFNTHLKHIYQTDMLEPVPTSAYHFHNSTNSNINERIYRHDSTWSIKPLEKNKVKFSDTVTVAVVSEPPSSPDTALELADSLPLCAPNKYLAAFAPAPPKLKPVTLTKLPAANKMSTLTKFPAVTKPSAGSNAPVASLPLAQTPPAEIPAPRAPKIKVVHFGMV
ncbi:WD repeat-containing and planar cell polarity effector protein fritz [Battus philenor]|uniref:WD repeat-containing and planar cell polarity effector protein fritz n=1 Tax=Battus philenor TaxID=42288 RepID=UPI0035D10482